MKLPGLHSDSNNKIYVGFDLSDDYCRISYCEPMGTIETVSAVAGSEQYSIPVVLAKKSGANQWFFGQEAKKLYEDKEQELVLVDCLLEKAVIGEMIPIEDKFYEPVSLLSLFIKRCISLLFQHVSSKNVQAILFTTKSLETPRMEVLQRACKDLRLNGVKYYFQNYTESFYHYVTNQQGALWSRGALLIQYQDETIMVSRMETNQFTTPVVVYISEEKYPFNMEPRSNKADAEYEWAQIDKGFSNLIDEIAEVGEASSVFLIGEEFKDEWMKESLKNLCSRYRVFRGNNLFSKGAVYGLISRMVPMTEPQTHIFLGNDKLSSNVGMMINRQGEEVYFALLDAGENWYECSKEFDFYISESGEIELRIQSLFGGEIQIAKILLEEYAGDLRRLRMRLYMKDVKSLICEIEDLGLGNIRPATHHVWHEEISV